MENLVVRMLPRRRIGILLRYGASAAIVGVAAMLRYSFDDSLHAFPLLLFIPAVFICALLFDNGTGFFATLLSAAIATYYFVEPVYSWSAGGRNWIALLLFIGIGFIMAGVTESLRRTILKLDESEAATALLLEELAHRTKNDLAIISSTITLQMNSTKDDNVRAALEAANARVVVVSQAQDRLRASKTGGQVDLASYVQALCNGLGDLLREIRPIAIRVKCEKLWVPSSVAVHVGLIVNELVTNSLKYAYPADRGGTVSVEVGRSDGQMTVIVADDGVGCPPDAEPGLGSRLVRLLAKQLGGKVERQASDVGCTMRVTLDESRLLHSR